MKQAVGFIHAGASSLNATVTALEARGRAGDARHVVDATLVDPQAASFPIDDGRYAAVARVAAGIAPSVQRLVLSCSVYNGVAAALEADLQLPVSRSDGPGTRQLLEHPGGVGILLSYAPSFPVVADYVAERFAQREDGREIGTSIAPDAFGFSSDAERYRRALIDALAPLRLYDVLFVAQFSMHPHLDALRAAWGRKPLVSALDAVLDEVFGPALV